ncbi:MAG: hypothetical protein AAF625_03865 [Pseudomonadota bacterium]
MPVTSTIPTIAGFWFGSDLSWLERLCIQSFLDNGHPFVLYVADRINGVPHGVETRPAADIFWPPPFDLRAADRQRVAVFSDLFRLRVFQKTGFIWADLDAYCVRPFQFDSDFVFGASAQGTYLTGVLRLPDTSPTLAHMLDFVTSANPTQPWRGSRLRRDNQRRIASGDHWGIEDLPWGCSGPKALDFFLRQTGEDTHALPACTLYPLDSKNIWKLHDPYVQTSDIERETVRSVHIFGHQKKRIATEMSGVPIPGSYLERLCQRHGVDPAANPIRPLTWMSPDRRSDQSRPSPS